MFARLSIFQKILQDNCIDLSTQQKLNIDQKGVQQINFAINLTRGGVVIIYFIIEQANNFLKGAVKYYIFFCFDKILIKMAQYNTLNVTLSNSIIVE